METGSNISSSNAIIAEVHQIIKGGRNVVIPPGDMLIDVYHGLGATPLWVAITSGDIDSVDCYTMQTFWTSELFTIYLTASQLGNSHFSWVAGA
jgi:hypothetical protein